MDDDRENKQSRQHTNTVIRKETVGQYRGLWTDSSGVFGFSRKS